MNTFLDPHWANEEKNKALAQAFAAAPELWKKDAYNAISLVAFLLPELTSDDIWKVLWKPPNGGKALGPVMGVMGRVGWLQKTDRLLQTAQVARNGGNVRIWRSKVYGTQPPPGWEAALAAWKPYLT
jgi:hypothetical protein